ncbi:dTDP-4-dehydrorhamnose 35-epimerase related [Acidimicrobium ferrooxidans DSM 10331]|uniref:dTDP-4-dehydrorhamnose 35-epimerase related n=1 Tax=Acidimicrobium ferrooxidans (strain DSM 10331 / JCM 15462 / NBRC 103882 / ICP) TaxID=525909 RepID=C7M3A7_ACIFD|nr:dTDP-4-dehydrorhamnose 3,5-epimerase [Acidimicrobium ferrooxidans]ACU53501.1 dTDP-4-dehydrorhamnose 35-epimerase related [Acidimicrobium ferrooxidans DSM 10331]
MAHGEIADVIVIRPTVHADARGAFQETYRRSWFPLGREMVQGSRSDKVAGSLVGMHYHLHQADYWYVVRGTAQVLLYDFRHGSRTEGTTWSLLMGDEDPIGLFIPPGVAHGFAALTDLTLTYLVDGYYNPDDELGLRWNDPTFHGLWQLDDPVISERDQTNPLIAQVPPERRPSGRLRTA